MPGKPTPGKRSIAIALVALAALALAAGPAVLAKKKSGKQPRGPYPSLGDCQVFPTSGVGPGSPSVADQSAWNQDVSSAPLDPNSASYIAHVNSHGGNMLHPDFGSPREYGFPYSVTGKRPKPKPVKFLAYGDESSQGRYRIPAKALIEGGQASDGDRHLLSINRKKCRLYELYRAFRLKKKGRWSADSGVIWDLNSSARHTETYTSADAAGLPIFPGLVRFDEAASGQINHAFRVTVSETRRAYIHPAVHCASDVTTSNAPPMGLRLRLNAGYDVSGFTGPARAIAEALKRYGLIVADNGSNWFFSGTSDRRWDDENLNQLKAIPGSAFEVVQSAASVVTC
jgi:hypothetical protein